MEHDPLIERAADGVNLWAMLPEHPRDDYPHRLRWSTCGHTEQLRPVHPMEMANTPEQEKRFLFFVQLERLQWEMELNAIGRKMAGDNDE